MRWLLAALMTALLIRSQTAMTAVSASCRLFVTAVLPGLLPYMALSAMLLSRCGGRASPGLLVLLGWGGGSPSGARLINLSPNLSRRQQRGIAVATATMSPMFLVGTCGQWLNAPWAGVVLLVSVLAGGGVAGLLASACAASDGAPEHPQASPPPPPPLTFGAAVEQSARTLLLVAGTMALWGMFATLAAEALPALALPVTTLLEVTAGTYQIAALPLPLAARTALMAGAAGFNGAAIIMQNRALYQMGREKPLLSLGTQLFWQAVHGGFSALLALGMMVMAGG